jgi:hypothetical protein
MAKSLVKALLIFTILSVAPAAFAQPFYFSTDVTVFRAGRDGEMRDKKETPLTEADLPLFMGLSYFDNNPAYRLQAVYSESKAGKRITFATSSGHTRIYLQTGVFKFRLNGKAYQLQSYESENVPADDEYKDLLFVPFKDKTGGNETYGGGRYLSIARPRPGKAILDFNLAYNPSCAYGSDRYSCPLPPKANALPIEIRAGEKKYASPGAAAVVKAGIKK